MSRQAKRGGWSEDERPWVKITHRVLDEARSGTEFAVWAVLSKHRNWGRPEDIESLSRPGRSTIQAAIGHLGLDPKSVTLATNALQVHGLLRKRHSHRNGGTQVRYHLDVAGPYVQFDERAVGLMAHRLITPEDLLWLARWQRACGEAGWTADSRGDMVERYKSSPTVVQRHRRALIQIGLLASQGRPGYSNVTRTLDQERLDVRLDELLGRDAWGSAATATWS